MEITTIIGVVAAIGAVVFGISFDEGSINFSALQNFFDPTSIFIVIGGTFFVLLAAFPLNTFRMFPRQMKMIFGREKSNQLEYVEVLVELSREARKKGLLALEDKANAFEDEFLKESVLLIVDAIEPDKLKAQFTQKLEYIARRDEAERKLFEVGAALAPAFGMLGTLIGLINMLKSMNLDGGAGALGQDMSVALITTFYGSMLANVFFTPMANKLEIAQEKEMILKEMIIEGVISIKEGENPKYIREKLLNFLPPDIEEAAGEGEGGAGGGGEGGKSGKKKAPKKKKEKGGKKGDE